MLCRSHLCTHAISTRWWWNKCSYSSIWHLHWTGVNGPLFFFFRCCNVLGSQNAHPSTEAYISRTLFFSVLFITNHTADALSDLSWTAVLALAEPSVENSTVRFCFFREPFHPHFAFLHFWDQHISEMNNTAISKASSSRRNPTTVLWLR